MIYQEYLAYKKYNLLRRRDESDVMETCALEEISYICMVASTDGDLKW